MNELSIKTTDFPTAEVFDAEMRSHFGKQQLAVHLNGPTFGERLYSQGTREWNDSPDIRENPGFRIKNWTFDSQTGVILTWDHSKVVPTDVPIALIRTTTMGHDLERLGLHTAEEVWLGQPRGQKIMDLAFDLQFDTAQPKWKAAGLALRIGAVALGGHQASLERCRLINWGAWGYEGFPWCILGTYDKYDRDLIATLDPTTHIFNDGIIESECSHITDCLAEDVDETLSNDQVTIRYIGGSMGNPDADTWVQTPIAYAYQRGNRTLAQGKNLFQCHTIYNSLRGDIYHNESIGAAVGVYGDFCKNKGLHIWENKFLGCDYSGIRFFLGPRGPMSPSGKTSLAEQFSHEDYEIGINQITSHSGVQVDFGTYEKQFVPSGALSMPTSATRYIRNMKVDASLVLEEKGSVGTIRTGQVLAANKGCRFNPFGK